MEAVGIALSVAQTLFAALQSTQLKEICSIFGKESELVEFQNTVDTVKAVLLDADNKDNIPDNKTRLYIQQLKDVVYDADDLLDEFVTLAEQIQQIKGGKAYEKTLSLSGGEGRRLVLMCMRGTLSELGREDDVKKIIGLLLDDSNMKENVSFLTIVGIGGLGKTALAQLVFSDKKLKSAFPLRLWTCVSDHDQEQLDVQGILRNILASDIGKKDEELTMDRVQKQLREKLATNRYVLVLDDVWTENHNQWQKLIEFLLGGQKGSWIVVTTRSHETATIVGGGQVHKLQGLSKENSWLLFEKIAFGVERSSTNEELVKIGREIVEQCAGVPLAIRVAGSLLFGQDTSKWLSFQKIGLSNLRGSQTDIMPILKLSYNQLEPSLKSCFTYCALFPKDFEMRKELLINLWMAQGFIVPLEGQKVEDVAEEYFVILLRRCFFQDVSHDAYSFEIISCKMHDLMHDMAQNIAGKEIICAIDSVINNIDERVRHLALMSNESGQYSFTKSHIRSLIFIGRWDCWLQQASVEALVASCVCLRVLDLKKLVLKSLPDSIGNLWHLRFLDVSFNHELEVLPKSVTKLYNLETLRLTGCSKLKELPEDVIKLVKLRILDVFGCSSLTHMPRGMSKLSCIHTLGRFAVKSTCWKQMFDELEELKGLKGLKGRLHINISLPWNNDLDINEGNIKEGAYLRNKEHIDEMIIEFNGI